ncbi:MAG: hypothetical protein EOM00_14350 [Clostridia bacterium]|nr:hypothetical protein [Clostridia bacterium]
MNTQQSVPIRKEWALSLLDILRFFLQHSVIEYDGTNRMAKVNYNGPSGWKFSLNTSFQPIIDAYLIDDESEEE